MNLTEVNVHSLFTEIHVYKNYEKVALPFPLGKSEVYHQTMKIE